VQQIGVKLLPEAPLFVPLHLNSDKLTRRREGEGDRAFTASAGSSALVAGLVVIPYILDQLRARAPSATATLDWRVPLVGFGRLLLFEAFVTHQPKADPSPHIRDARLAIGKFWEAMQDPASFQCEVSEPSSRTFWALPYCGLDGPLI
jgi:hypothetical protein